MTTKRETELTESDLDAHPVWQYADVETGLVSPRVKRGSAPLLSLVSTIFTAANGHTYRGFSVTTKIALLRLTLFHGGRQVELHFRGHVPTANEVQEAYRALGTTQEGLFPVHFRAVPPLKHKPIWDSVDSFSFQALDGSIQEVR
jgi:hypothetical protein